jgi:TatA/E family protein of Tat protein translocase
MFGLGPTELIVILVLALLVLGPSRIPEVASSLGKAIRGFRRASKELREQIDIDDEVRRPLEDLRAALRDEPIPLPPPPPSPSIGGLVTPPSEAIHSTAHDHDHDHDVHPGDRSDGTVDAGAPPQEPAARVFHPMVTELGPPPPLSGGPIPGPSGAPIPGPGDGPAVAAPAARPETAK